MDNEHTLQLLKSLDAEDDRGFNTTEWLKNKEMKRAIKLVAGAMKEIKLGVDYENHEDMEEYHKRVTIQCREVLKQSLPKIRKLAQEQGLLNTK